MARVLRARGDVSWHMPDGRGGFRKRPFAYSTVAESDLMRAFAEDGHTFIEGRDRCYYAPTERALCEAFIEAGYGDTLMKEFIA